MPIKEQKNKTLRV